MASTITTSETHGIELHVKRLFAFLFPMQDLVVLLPCIEVQTGMATASTGTIPFYEIPF